MSNFSEDPKERAGRYIANFSIALEKITMTHGDSVVLAANISRVTDAVRRYLDDAQHYLNEGRPTTSLASIAYAEGLLDALTFLELARPRNLQ
jgi:hypothetical protein